MGTAGQMPSLDLRGQNKKVKQNVLLVFGAPKMEPGFSVVVM